MADRGLAEKLANLPGDKNAVQGALDDVEDDNGVTEIESLCMNCHGNVSCTITL
jgi:hypothetical protein